MLYSRNLKHCGKLITKTGTFRHGCHYPHCTARLQARFVEKWPETAEKYVIYFHSEKANFEEICWNPVMTGLYFACLSWRGLIGLILVVIRSLIQRQRDASVVGWSKIKDFFWESFCFIHPFQLRLVCQSNLFVLLFFRGCCIKCTWIWELFRPSWCNLGWNLQRWNYSRFNKQCKCEGFSCWFAALSKGKNGEIVLL